MGHVFIFNYIIYTDFSHAPIFLFPINSFLQLTERTDCLCHAPVVRVVPREAEQLVHLKLQVQGWMQRRQRGEEGVEHAPLYTRLQIFWARGPGNAPLIASRSGNLQIILMYLIVQTLTLWALAREFGQYNHLSRIMTDDDRQWCPNSYLAQ